MASWAAMIHLDALCSWQAVAELTSDRATVQEELDAILEALAKLEDS